MSRFTARVDAREHAPAQKHKVIFDTWNSLESGQEMELFNDHDPKPLYYQFAAEHAGEFDWEYLEEGPEQWHVAIKKV